MKKSNLLFGIIFILAFTLVALSACSAPATSPTTGSTTSPSTPIASSTQPGDTSNTTQQPADIIQLISPADAKAMLESNPDVLLLDVRTPEEYAAGHIAGSVLLPYDQIEGRAGELPADKAAPIIVYCRTGRRSAIAAEVLAGLGYSKIYDLGGIQDWPYDIVKGEK
ncbi:MAG TPA: rhodanese-like domain-containing protein [Clostridiales bacterium]|nr:rhodanese-like domain-containing protein [Clostridiales bacterium]